MSLEEAVLEKLRVLPEPQKPVKKVTNNRPRLLGKYAHLQVSLQTSDLLEAREEMWAQFLRDIEL